MSGTLILLVALLPAVTLSQQANDTTYIYMDSPTVCGQTVIMDDKDLFVVKPRGTVGLSNPPVECTVVLQQPYSSDKYVFEVEVEYAQFQDCSVQLMVFSGPTPDGKYERLLGCGSSTSSGYIYVADNSLTLLLTRARDQYLYGTDFQLRVQLYYDNGTVTDSLGHNVFMDSQTVCGNMFTVNPSKVFIVKPRSTDNVSDPPTECVVVFESSYVSSYRRFEIVVESAQFQDCSMELKVFQGATTEGTVQKVLGCGPSTSSAYIILNSGSVTLLLTRYQGQETLENDFQLRVSFSYNSWNGEENLQQVFMDRPLECDGGTFSVADDDIFIVEPREPLHDSRPPNECIVSFKSYDSSSDQGFEVVVESAQFHDCSMELQVYKGSATAGAYERLIGCGTSGSTGHIYLHDRMCTLRLVRTQDQYNFGNRFRLRVQIYQSFGNRCGEQSASKGIRAGIMTTAAAATLVKVLATGGMFVW